jgi:sugar phosphate isomerase/epimerase
MALQEIGIFAKTFARSSVERNMQAVAEHGLGVAHYNMACAGLPSLPDRIPPGVAKRVGEAAAAHDIRIVAVSGTFNMIDPHLQRRAEGLRRLREIASACAALGTRTITLCTGTRDPEDMWRGHPQNTSPEAWAELLQSMEVAIGIADEFDLELGVEPETANVIDSAGAARQLFNELQSPRLKIVIDPANLFNVGDMRRQRAILEQAFDILGDDIVMGHAKDVREVNGEIRHVAAGTGFLDYAHYLRLLEGLDVPLIVHGLGEDEVPGSLAFLRAMTTSSKEEDACLSSV